MIMNGETIYDFIIALIYQNQLHWLFNNLAVDYIVYNSDNVFCRASYADCLTE